MLENDVSVTTALKFLNTKIKKQNHALTELTLPRSDRTDALLP